MKKPPRTETPGASDRLRALEEQAAYQQQMLDQFHEVLLRQQTEIDKLAAAQMAVRSALDRLSAGDDLPHEKPPHY